MTSSDKTPETSAPDNELPEITPVKPPFMSNKMYDACKWVAMYVFSPLTMLVMSIGMIWNLDVMYPIALTISAFGTFFSGLLGYSTKNYDDYMNQIALQRQLISSMKNPTARTSATSSDSPKIADQNAGPAADASPSQSSSEDPKEPGK